MTAGIAAGIGERRSGEMIRMTLLEVLPKERILSQRTARDKKGVLAELVDALVTEKTIRNRRVALKALLERERLGSTGIGEGIAVPHGKSSEVHEIVAVFGRSREGVDFESMDGVPVHLVCMLIAPEDSPGTHLKVLVRIPRVLKDRATREELFRAETREDLYNIIARKDRRY